MLSLDTTASETAAFIVRRATPEQIRQAWTNNHVSWGAPDLELDQYIQREILLGQTPFATDRETWVLAPTDAPSDTLDFVAACETYRRPMLLGDGKGGVKEGVCVSIASVFTPEQHRGKGYAGMLLTVIMEMIKADETVLASTLYSEVGKTYYAKFGWDYAPSYVGTILVESYPETNPSTPPTPILASEIATVIWEDVDVLTEEMKTNISETFLVLPTAEAIQWFHACADYYAPIVGKVDPPPAHLGARLPNGDFIIWQHDWIARKIMVLRLRASAPERARDLLRVAVEEARKYGLKKVSMWNPDDTIVSGAVEGALEVMPREDDDSLSGVWQRDGDTNPVWVANEKYAWV
ncbi:hypothetical protein HK097_009031 [Rhizophlyctis rosea]|uniref:LYC1 C-terminal domain-containing protein n=1 Tax=Rhizophlyctis rosea TaxID=64517 RepID=A0AAD5X7P8_9FUNG|nr:hypothetical protein HK097_009031 [Rhizophlyctis rosea]